MEVGVDSEGRPAPPDMAVRLDSEDLQAPAVTAVGRPDSEGRPAPPDMAVRLGQVDHLAVTAVFPDSKVDLSLKTRKDLRLRQRMGPGRSEVRLIRMRRHLVAHRELRSGHPRVHNSLVLPDHTVGEVSLVRPVISAVSRPRGLMDDRDGMEASAGEDSVGIPGGAVDLEDGEYASDFKQHNCTLIVFFNFQSFHIE
jgi:hypothetical protein